MKLVIDANVLISAIIKDSVTRKIILDERTELYSPGKIIEEVIKHSDLIAKKANLSNEEVLSFFRILMEKIKIVPEKEYREKIPEALSIARNFDEKDTLFIALALKLKIPVWTSDKGILDNQGKYQAVNTKDVLEGLSKS
ncbi:putative toxin-antitoxin system toxin component, PIN family [Archaeoglobales archaeon]|nr:MAG: putative toxin-antitoxin system toxin component, PIN family [Archaeoglobales archaeon]